MWTDLSLPKYKMILKSMKRGFLIIITQIPPHTVKVEIMKYFSENDQFLKKWYIKSC